MLYMFEEHSKYVWRREWEGNDLKNSGLKFKKNKIVSTK